MGSFYQQMGLKTVFLFVLILFGKLVHAQNIQAKVRVINRTQNRSFESQYRVLERDLSQLINQTRWFSNTTFSAEPKVILSLTMSIIDHSNNRFNTILLVEVFKPYGKTDKALLLRWVEQPLAFTYAPFEPLVYTKNMLSSNLVAHAAFFSYLAMGFYKDTESILGGTLFFREAEDIVVRMQSTLNSGWEMRRNGTSKYRLIYELLQKDYFPVRQFNYSLYSGCFIVDNFVLSQESPCVVEALERLNASKGILMNSLLLQRIQDINSAVFKDFD
jgi:hypothetical protein